MIKKHFSDVKEEIVTKANSTQTTVRWLISKKDGARSFATRRFEIEPGGKVGLHDHDEDHHIYILQGRAIFFDDKDNWEEVSENDVVYIPPNEAHGIANDGQDKFIFICIIPYLD
ncbi:MAG: cupin domain-containing protein [Candidatus Lokiarchaeota archaeon]|nr:cupin domain-containing protein [Candidatus Lokiarchaeota archaeon]MBD3341555.1 cupin domain-containing protein [Candidatus Lokiarchaeota archaeon]